MQKNWAILKNRFFKIYLLSFALIALFVNASVLASDFTPCKKIKADKEFLKCVANKLESAPKELKDLIIPVPEVSKKDELDSKLDPELFKACDKEFRAYMPELISTCRASKASSDKIEACSNFKNKYWALKCAFDSAKTETVINCSNFLHTLNFNNEDKADLALWECAKGDIAQETLKKCKSTPTNDLNLLIQCWKK